MRTLKIKEVGAGEVPSVCEGTYQEPFYMMFGFKAIAGDTADEGGGCWVGINSCMYESLPAGDVVAML
jgi:hypothetical protein